MNFNAQIKAVAGGNIAPSTFVKASTAADNTVLQAGAGDKAIAVSQEGMKGTPGLSGSDTTIAAASGDQVMLFGLGDQCLLKAGTGGVAHGDFLMPESGGTAITATAGSWFGAIALESGAASALVRCVVVCGYLPGAQQAAIAALTDSSGGTSGGNTIAAITQAGNAGSADIAPTKNAIATLAAKVNAIQTALHNAGITL